MVCFGMRLTPARLLVLNLLLLVPLCRSAAGITVSGRVVESDGAPVAGVTITVEQVGGELPNLITTTAANGNWSVSDPVLFGNIRVTPSAPGFTFAPTNRTSFTSIDLPGQNFTATPTAPRPNIGVLNGTTAAIIASGGTLAFTRALVVGNAETTTLVVRNDGSSALTGIGLSFTGADAASFSVLTAPPATLAPGASAVVTVQGLPAGVGTGTANLLIASNDPNENPFVVTVSYNAVSLRVTNAADSGAGSLRQAVANAALTSGTFPIVLDTLLAGQTIFLASEIPVPQSTARIDASGLAGGLTLSGQQANRLFTVAAGATLDLTGLTLRDGFNLGSGGGAISNAGTTLLKRCLLTGHRAQSGRGGAIANLGVLTVTESTLSGNISAFDSGGAIYSENALLRLFSSTLSGNMAKRGGAIAATGVLELTGCTLTGNSLFSSDTVADSGGAIQADQATLTRCTVARNSGLIAAGIFVNTVFLSQCTIAGNNGGFIGGVWVLNNGTLQHCTVTGNTATSNAAGVPAGVSLNAGSITHSIIAGNSAPSSTPDLFANAGAVLTQNLIGGDPLLAPLGDYGGSLETCALLPGSPARNAAASSNITSDQRGFPIVGVPDLGAYEAGTLGPNFHAYIWETLPVGATLAQHAPGFDFDGDGFSNQDEWLAQTEAAHGASFFALTASQNAGQLVLRFPSAATRTYVLQQNETLSPGAFSAAPGVGPLAGTGAELSFVLPVPAEPKRFYRVVVMP